MNQNPLKTNALGRSFACSLNNGVDVDLLFMEGSLQDWFTGAENFRININYSKHLEQNIKTDTLFRPQTS